MARGLGFLFFCASLLAMFISPDVLARLLLVFSSDGVVQQKTVMLAKSILTTAAPFFCVMGGLSLGYAFLGGWIGRHPAVHEASPPEVLMAGKMDRVVLCLILVLALVVRWPLLFRSLSYDELATWFYFISPASVQSLFHISVQNHVGCTLLAWLSTALWGVSEVSLRSPSLVLGLLSIFIAGEMTRRVLGRRIAFLTMAFLALSPVHAILSTSVRGYIGVILFAFISMVFYIWYLRSPRRRVLFSYVLVNILGLLFHPFFLFLLFAQLLGLGLLARDDKKQAAIFPGTITLWKALGVTILSAAGIYVPRVLDLCLNMIHDSRLFVFQAVSVETFKDLLGTTLITTVITLTVIGIGFWSLRKTVWRAFVVVTLLLGVFAMVLCLFVPPGYLVTRYWVAMIPFLFIGFSTGLAIVFDWLRPRSLLLAALVVALPVGLVLEGWQSSRQTIVADLTMPYREVCAFAQASASQDTVFFAIGHGAGHFQYYFRERPIHIIGSMKEYKELLQTERPLACFVLPDLGQVPEVAVILQDVRARAQGRAYQMKDVAVLFMEDDPPGLP